MELALTPEQLQLRQVVRDFLAEHSGEQAVRSAMATEAGCDQDVWRRMATDLGLQGILIPENLGGSGGTTSDLVIVMEELGRVLCCTPYLATAVLATGVMLRAGSGDADAAGYLARIAAGEITATLAAADETGLPELAEGSVRAELAAGNWQLSGSKAFVVDGCSADLVLVSGQAPEGLSVFAVERGTTGLTCKAMDTLDQTRKQARLSFRATPARLVGQAGSGRELLEHALNLGSIALAAEQLGGARRCLDIAVAHARQRVQFGRPIGSFQAIKHRLADMLLDLELCAAGVRYASRCEQDGSDEAADLAPMVQAHAADSYLSAATEMIQVLGGIGFTWEHPAHLYFKRATASASLLGGPSFHRDRLAARLGLGRPGSAAS